MSNYNIFPGNRNGIERQFHGNAVVDPQRRTSKSIYLKTNAGKFFKIESKANTPLEQDLHLRRNTRRF